jgi:hypothetical protein
MYRQRRRQLRRRRRATGLVSLVVVLGLLVAIPTVASAAPVSNLLNQLGNPLGLGGDTGSGGAAAPSAPATRAGAPPSYVPPLHGTDPHGQGTDADVDLNPSHSNPLSGDPAQTGEEAVVGDSRGSQDSSGQYHGAVTLAYLAGSPIVQVTTNPGETKDGPLQPLQDGLDQLCAAPGAVCLQVLAMHSSTTAHSSSNTFTGANLSIGGPAGINANALGSRGDIWDDGTCQTAHGHSRVAGVGVAAPAGQTANVAEGDSWSTACNNGYQSTTQSSKVINLAGTGVPIPAAGCANGTPNTNFVSLAPLLSTVCNADDTNGSQTSSPYGVREALGAFVLAVGGSPLVKGTTAGPESHAQAPPGPGTRSFTGAPGTSVNKGPKKGANKSGNNGGGNGNGPGRSAAANAAAGNGQLAFTGADLLALGLVGGALILGGLALTTAGGRHRQTVYRR